MSTATPVALITGGAKRVGRAIALELAHAGFDIAFTYRTSSRESEELLALLDSMGRKSLAIHADLADPALATDLIFSGYARVFSRLDVLVNNASTYQPANLANTTLELIRCLNAVHLETPLLLAQKFESMLRAARGHIINMSDLLAARPWPQYLAYCASKAALSNLTLGLARELAPEVTVNAIAPGVVDWPDDFPEAQRRQYLQRVPLARAGTPDDVAKLVRFLATSAPYITGQILPLDGGRSIT